MINSQVIVKLEKVLEKVAVGQKIKNPHIKVHVEEQTKNGFLGDFFFAEITSADTNQVLHLAIKRAFEKVTKEHENTIESAYINEIFFYDEIYPVLDKLQKDAGAKEPFNNIAKKYATQKDVKPNLLVFEDITKIGFVLFEKKDLFPQDHLELIFARYAKFHALSFVLKKRNRKQFNDFTSNLIDVFDDFVKIDKLNLMIKDAGKACYKYIAPEDKELRKAAAIYSENSMKLFENVLQYDGEYSCILHGDCWSNNMMFKYDPSGKLEDICMIDFQICKEGTPVHDLSYFFYTGASKENLDKLEYYLKLYHSSFSKFVLDLGEDPEDLYPFEALWKDWRTYSKFGLIMAFIVGKMKLIEKSEIADSFKDKEETELPLDLINTGNFNEDVFSKRIRDLFAHVYEIGAL